MVCVGVITAAHGVRGGVRIKSFTEAPFGIAAYGPVSDAEGQRFELAVTGESKGLVLAQIAGIADRESAEALKGRQLFVPRGTLPQPDEDEFYHADLVGLRAERAGDDPPEAIGTVVAVHDFGAGAILEVAQPDGPPVLVPFTNDAVPTVDIAGGRVIVAPLPGLLSGAELTETKAGR